MLFTIFLKPAYLQQVQGAAAQYGGLNFLKHLNLLHQDEPNRDLPRSAKRIPGQPLLQGFRQMSRL